MDGANTTVNYLNRYQDCITGTVGSHQYGLLVGCASADQSKPMEQQVAIAIQ